MAKITPNALVDAISGRACNQSDTYYATNKQTGKVYAVKLCHPYEGEASEAQTAHRKAFGSKAKKVSAWLTANKPSDSNPDGTEQYQKVLAAYKTQHKIGNIFAFVSKHMDADGNINIGSTSETTQYTLTLSASPAVGGAVSGAGKYDAGTSVTIKATANSGYTFSRWSDGNTSATRSLTINADTDLTAVFGSNSIDDDDSELIS